MDQDEKTNSIEQEKDTVEIISEEEVNNGGKPIDENDK